MPDPPQPVTSDNYKAIMGWLDPNPRKTFKASGYKKDGADDDGAKRLLCPHVLGYQHKGGNHAEKIEKERVLCWQLTDPGTDVDNPQWRCYRVNDLVDIAEATDEPWVMGNGYSQRQNAVQNEKFQVPYPD